MLYPQLQVLNPVGFRRACGVKRETFLVRVEVLNPDLERHGKRGGQNRLRVEDPWLIALSYWRQYRTRFDIELKFGVSEATVCRTIEKVEALLVKSGRFRLPGKRQLQQAETPWEAVVIDVTEGAAQKKQRAFYSGTHKRHSLKAQLVIDLEQGQFLAVATGKGRSHDLRLFKRSKVRSLNPCYVWLTRAIKASPKFMPTASRHRLVTDDISPSPVTLNLSLYN